MFIDIHGHVFRHPATWRDGKPSFCTPEQLLARHDEIGIERGVLLPLVSPECFLPQGNEEIFEIAAAHPGRFIPFTVPGPKSTQRHCEMCVTDMEWNGAPAYVVSIRDRTEHERVQLLEQRLRDLQSGPWLSRRKSSPGF